MLCNQTMQMLCNKTMLCKKTMLCTKTMLYNETMLRNETMLCNKTKLCNKTILCNQTMQMLYYKQCHVTKQWRCYVRKRCNWCLTKPCKCYISTIHSRICNQFQRHLLHFFIMYRLRDYLYGAQVARKWIVIKWICCKLLFYISLTSATRAKR